MTTIFVANTTKQNWDFHFRVPENTRLFVSHIPVGGQERIYKDDMSSPEADSIMAQLVLAGAVDAKEVDRTKAFIGLCYSVDKPVNHNAVHSALEHNDDVLELQGHDLRKAAAVAIDAALDKDGQQGLTGTTVTIKEDVKRGEKSSDTLDETIEVRKQGDAPKPKARRRK